MKEKLMQALEQLMAAATKYHEKHPEVGENAPKDKEWEAAWQHAEQVLTEAKSE